MNVCWPVIFHCHMIHCTGSLASLYHTCSVYKNLIVFPIWMASYEDQYCNSCILNTFQIKKCMGSIILFQNKQYFQFIWAILKLGVFRVTYFCMRKIVLLKNKLKLPQIGHITIANSLQCLCQMWCWSEAQFRSYKCSFGLTAIL